MKRFREIALRFLRPGAGWAVLLTITSAAGLLFVFLNGLDTAPLGYAVYVLSAYTMTVLALAVPGIYKKAKAMLYGNKYSNRYLTDAPFREKVSLYTSLCINLIYALLQLFIGIYYASFWYGAVAVYYMVICGVRFLLLYYFRKGALEPQQELKAHRFCGLLLFVLNIAVAGMVVQMVRDGQGARYPGLMIYAMAAYAFYRIILSIINVIQQRRMKSPVLAASKALSFATALMAIFSLETAMLNEFGGTGAFEGMMNTATGSAVCLIVFCMAIFMVRRANRELKKLRMNETQT